MFDFPPDDISLHLAASFIREFVPVTLGKRSLVDIRQEAASGTVLVERPDFYASIRRNDASPTPMGDRE